MVATYDTNKLRSASERRMVDYDIDGALNLVDLGTPQGAGNKCLPIAVHRRFLAGLFRSVSAPATVTAFQIVASTSAAGANLTVVVQHAIGTAPDAVGDTIWLECDAEQIREVLASSTHVGVRVDLVDAGDECVVYFERAHAFYNPGNLTGDFIS